MNTKRPYLDALNAGRQRNPLSTLDQLNQSLQALEEQISRGREAAAEPRYPGMQPYGQRQGSQNLSWQQQGGQRHNPSTQAAAQPASRFGQNYQSIARDIDRMRGQEDNLAAASKIAGELQGLREELRSQMTSGLHREFEALREDIERASHSSAASRESEELGREFERLSSAIETLAEKSDDRSINSLRLEMEQVRTALDMLAREESLRSVDRRFDDLDDRWNAFEARIDARQSDDAAIAMLGERLEQIGIAVNNLPESLSLRSLEEKVRTLAGAVDHFVSRENDRSGNTLAMIDERLDEISRAIVASTVAAQASSFDPETLERIEQRIGALAAQIEEVAAERPGEEVIARLNLLTARVDDLAAHADLPRQAMERLGQQIALIAGRIDEAPAMPDPDYLLQGLEQRFEALSNLMDRRQGDALEQSSLLIRDLERRLAEVAARLDERPMEPQVDSAGIMDAIDARFTALAERNLAGAAVRGLEDRLENISARLDVSAAQVASIDPNLIRSLEAQVAGLSAHLAQPAAPLPDFEDIAPRLGDIERSLAATQESILGAAREAAENAVRSLAGANVETAAVTGLADDLKALETLTRRSDERNSRTFEAIHDTLLKIVDRLGSLEQLPAAEPISEPKITVREAPSMDPDRPSPLAEGMAALDAAPSAPELETPVRTPAQAAAAAALAALGDDPVAEKPEPGRKKSMFSGLARAFSKKDQEQPMLAGSADASDVPAELDEPLDPRLANQPLEPGSGAPDLNAIMKRVRDERGQSTKAGAGTSEASQSDFIAAARRAAQAAAAEADAMKRQSSIAGPVRALRIGDLLKARRKPLLMATTAIAVALAGTLLGKALLSDPAQTASTDTPAVTAPAEIADASSPEERKAETAVTETSNEAVRMVGKDDTSSAPVSVEASAAVDADSATANAVAPDETTAALPATVSSGTDAPGPMASAPLATGSPLAIPAEAGPAALRQAAAEGDAKAQFEIGSRYAEARGVKEDMAQAAMWYERAADLGFAPAQYRIGNFYEKGIGVERDIQKAKTWYQLAAGQGNASAMHNLAVLFAMAADGVTDNESAVRWFEAAADLGVKDSQFNLGILAAKGVGMKQNLEEAYKWFTLVANAGDKDAASKRDEVANALRPEQLEHARAAAALWKAKPVDQAANAVDIPVAWQDAEPAPTSGIDMKKAVQNIQRILAKNGYDAGSVDGVMGEKTKAAIVAFQGDNNLAPTGEVDRKLVEALLAKK